MHQKSTPKNTQRRVFLQLSLHALNSVKTRKIRNTIRNKQHYEIYL